MKRATPALRAIIKKRKKKEKEEAAKMAELTKIEEIKSTPLPSTHHLPSTEPEIKPIPGM